MLQTSKNRPVEPGLAATRLRRKSNNNHYDYPPLQQQKSMETEFLIGGGSNTSTKYLNSAQGSGEICPKDESITKEARSHCVVQKWNADRVRAPYVMGGDRVAGQS